MHVTILGSGTAIPVPDRFPAGYFAEHDGSRVMVDCGPGSLRRLAQAGSDLRSLDAVLLTHYHTDHCADIAALLFALRSPHFADRQPLHIYGAPGLERLVRTLTQAWPWLEPRGYELELHELSPGTFDVGSAEQGGPALNRTLLVRNAGSAPLSTSALTATPPFIITEGLDPVIATGSFDTFTIELPSTSVGTFTGEISFNNNDLDENPFQISVTGTIHAP